MFNFTSRRRLAFCLAALLAGPMLAGAADPGAQVAGTTARPAAKTAAASAAAGRKSPYHPESITPSAMKGYYQSVWGVDNLLVRETASGNLIRFSYRVLDPARAKLLGDDHATPYLYGQRSRAVLSVPVMDKVGKLRQTGTAIAGQEYWMVFSNKGHPVKSGDRVSVIIGSFHADGLMVE